MADPKDSSGKPSSPAYLMLDMPDEAAKGCTCSSPTRCPTRQPRRLDGRRRASPALYGDRTVYLLPKERVTWARHR